MRIQAILLPALLALACKSDPGDEAGESSSSTGDCGPADPAAVDPDYPPCDCDYKCADAGALCRFSRGDDVRSAPTSSICQPQCTNGPSCKNALDFCTDSDCLSFAGVTPACNGGRCVLLGCNDTKPCPTGYVCGGNNACEVEL